MKKLIFILLIFITISCSIDDDTNDCSDFNSAFSLIDTDGDGLTDCEETTVTDNPNTTLVPTEQTDPNIADQPIHAKINFSFKWDEQPVRSSDFNDLKYTNENGEQLSITRLRYLLSNIILVDKNDEEHNISAYNLIDLTNDDGLTYTSNNTIIEGEYKTIKFTVGFNENDNSGNYTDLNVVNWTWPNMLGGGYHIMQYEGKFLNTINAEQQYAMHMGTRRVSMNPNVFEPNHYEVTINLAEGTLINSGNEINIDMNIAEWFKNPNTWDLNVFNAPLMPVYAAQVMMHDNVSTVFSATIQ